jgi:trehalose 6-phosphate synthase/phosphatase
MFDTESKLDEVGRLLRESAPRVLVLDYDGTLVPFAATPGMAIPDLQLRELLKALAARCETHVVSGRDRPWLDTWFWGLSIGLHAEHGFWSRDASGSWQQIHPLTPDFSSVMSTFEDLVARTPCSFLEVKGASLAWHYRMAEPALIAHRREELYARLGDVLPASLELVPGPKVIELRPRAARKSTISRALIESAVAGGAAAGVLIAGDDNDDEEMFSSAPRSAITVHVGAGKSRARYRASSVEELRWLLYQLQ